MFSRLYTNIKDIETLEIALQELRLPFLKKARARDSEGGKIYADLVVLLKGSCDLAFSYNSERGTYDIFADLWGINCIQKPTDLINSINDAYNRNCRI